MAALISTSETPAFRAAAIQRAAMLSLENSPPKRVAHDLALAFLTLVEGEHVAASAHRPHGFYDVFNLGNGGDAVAEFEEDDVAKRGNGVVEEIEEEGDGLKVGGSRGNLQQPVYHPEVFADAVDGVFRLGDRNAFRLLEGILCVIIYGPIAI